MSVVANERKKLTASCVLVSPFLVFAFALRVCRLMRWMKPRKGRRNVAERPATSA